MRAGPLSVAHSSVVQLDSSSVMRLDSVKRLNSASVAGRDSASVTEKIGGLIARMFGCRHAELSRPFSRDGRAYRSCLSCGAQRQFDLGNWQMQGGFYYGRPQARQIPTAQ